MAPMLLDVGKRIERLLLRLRSRIPAVTAFVLVLLAVNWRHGSALSTFNWIEVVVLAFAAAVSTFNYGHTARTLESLGGDDLPALGLSLAMIPNTAAFLLAVVLLPVSWWHLWSLTLVYALFALSNLRQARVLSKDANQLAQNERRLLVLQALYWLREENGPAVVAYAIATGVLSAYGYFVHASAGKEMASQVSAFAGGAATFHLSLSILSYSYKAWAEDDVLEATADRVRWVPEDLSWLSEFAKDVRGWRWIIIVAVLLSAILAGLASVPQARADDSGAGVRTEKAGEEGGL